MGIIVRQGIKNSIIAYIGVSLGFLNVIYLFPHILDTDQYGLIRVMISISLLTTQVAQFGMKNTIVRYFPYFKNPEKGHRGLFFIAIFIPFVGFLICFLIFLIGKPLIVSSFDYKSDLFGNYFWFLFPLLLFTIYYEIFNNYLRSLYDSVTGSYVKEILFRLGTTILLLLYYFNLVDFSLFVFLFVLIYSLQPLILLIKIYYIGEFHIKPDFSFLNLPLIKRMASYSFYALLGGVTSMIVGNIDIVMLGSLTSLDNTAIYFVAFSIGSVIAIPQKSIHKIALPLVSTAINNNNFKKVENIYKRSSLNQTIAGFLIYIGIWANLHNLFTILPKEYAAGSNVILVIGLGKIFDMAAGINGGIINVSKHYRFSFYSNLIFIITIIVTNIILIPPYGILGAAIASTVSLFIYNLSKYIYVWKKLSMQPFDIRYLCIILISLIILYFSLHIDPHHNIYIDIIIRSFSILAIYLLAMISTGLSEDLNKISKSAYNTFVNHLK